jgi:hypothetical protein
MSFLKRAAAVAAALAVVCAPSQAAESVTGRWAADLSSCSSFSFNAEQSPLVVTGNAVRWRDDACRIARMYKTGDTVHIEALCWSLAGERSIPVSLRPHGGKLAVSWDRAPRGEFRRCQ